MNIALVGNPNSGKTSLFNLLTGSNQYVGNWPGVTVEKKEGSLKKIRTFIFRTYPASILLSPYTPEEVIARDYLVQEQPELIINIIDATNLERNLYLTTQLLDLDIPMIIGLNMMDVIKKEGKKSI
ncbi:50S ribosome-binding GTPase [Enterococcus faecium]|nr:50S ribosome-binding GTPase [Enterococcus faecium]